MIMYSSQLKTTETLTCEEFLRNVLASSGHIHADQVLSDLPETGIKKFFPDDADKQLTIAVDHPRKLSALKYEIERSGGYRITREYVLDEADHHLSIQTSVDFPVGDENTDYTEAIHAPKALSRLMDHGYLSVDSGLSITGRPHHLSGKSTPAAEGKPADFLASLQDESDSGQLPILFFIPSIFGMYPAEINKVATRLAGLAHVVTMNRKEADRGFQKVNVSIPRFRKFAIAFYPDRKEFVTLTMDHGKDPAESLFQKMLLYNFNHFRKCALSFEQIKDTIWTEQLLRSEDARQNAEESQKAAEIKLRQFLLHLDEEKQRMNEAAMEKAYREADQVVSSYEEDIQKLQEELEEKNLCIQGLDVENQRLRGHLDQGRIPLLYFGKEKEFYLGEIQDLLLSTLEDALKEVPAKSRRSDIITDILASNHYKHISKDRSDQIKHLLNGYNGMTSQIRRGLEKLVFKVEETNRHCKISYGGDPRYLAVFGSTPSDVRSGKNNAATLVRIAY